MTTTAPRPTTSSTPTWGRFLVIALTDFSRRNCPYIAAGIAYFALLSLFPLSLASISVLGFLYSTPAEQTRVIEAIVDVIPVSVDYLAPLIDDIARARGTLGVVAIVALLWSGTAVFSAVRKGVNHAWHIEVPHYFLLERAIDLIMLVALGALTITQVVVTSDMLGLSLPAWLPDSEPMRWALRAGLEIAALAVTFGLLALLYRFVPNTSVGWGDVWLGALMGAVVFDGVRIGFAWFVSGFGSFNVVYGSLGALMAVMVWAYLGSLAVMWGAQVAYSYSTIFGSRVGVEATDKSRMHATPVEDRRSSKGILATFSRLDATAQEKNIVLNRTGPEEIAPGIHQVRAIGAKVTAIFSGENILLVDAGARGSLRRIDAGLKALGRSLDQVHLLVLTHFHPDHSGGLGKLVEATSAPVAVHLDDAGIVGRKERVPSPSETPSWRPSAGRSWRRYTVTG